MTQKCQIAAFQQPFYEFSCLTSQISWLSCLLYHSLRVRSPPRTTNRLVLSKNVCFVYLCIYIMYLQKKTKRPTRTLSRDISPRARHCVGYILVNRTLCHRVLILLCLGMSYYVCIMSGWVVILNKVPRDYPNTICP